MITEAHSENLNHLVKKLRKEIIRRKRSEKHLSIVYNALNSSVSGVIITDKNGRITYANPSFLSMFEYKSKREVVGKCAKDLFVGQEIKKFADVEAIIDKARGETEEFLARRKDGTVFPVEVSSSSVTEKEGNIAERMASFVDITDRKKSEEALKISAENIKLFAYSISHDLKSLAIGIYGITKRLHEYSQANLDEKGKRYCHQILIASKQLATLVERINIYIATKQTPLSIEAIELAEVIRMIREEFADGFNTRGIRWSEPEHLPEIRADKLSILRVLRNLVDNSLKYGGNDLDKIEIAYEESDDLHIIAVKDNGIGINNEDSIDVFAPFKRKETSRSIDGAGLGLSIVKEIAERHGGKAWLEPGLEKGLTVNVGIGKPLRRLESESPKQENDCHNNLK